MKYEITLTLGFSGRDPIWQCRVQKYEIETVRGLKQIIYTDLFGDSGIVVINDNVPLVAEYIPVNNK